MGFMQWLVDFNERAKNSMDDGPPRPHADRTLVHTVPGDCARCDQFPSLQG